MRFRSRAVRMAAVASLAAAATAGAWAATAGGSGARTAVTQGYTNPVGGQGQDPSILTDGGFYYYTQANDYGDPTVITVRRASSLATLAQSPPAIAWRAGDAGIPADENWAPELHHFGGAWYIYFTAGAGDAHRMYVLRANDPLGPYTSLGQLGDSTNQWAIDGSVFRTPAGHYYMIWSGWPSAADKTQSIYLAAMDSPSHVSGPRILLSRPTLGWEQHGFPVNEGPYATIHGDTVYINYSASFCGTPDYSLGQLSANLGSDLTDPASWSKAQAPVFSRNDAAGVLGPGHHSTFTSIDGTQNLIAYHAVTDPNGNCGHERTVRVQPFTWNADGSPDFGIPGALGAEYALPSGDPGSTAKIMGPGDKCLDVAGTDSTANGTQVQIWDCDQVSERWTYGADGTLRTSGKCLDVDGNVTGGGAHLEIWDCNGVGGQVWTWRTNGSLVNPQSGRCLDLPSRNTTNGTPVQIWDCNGDAAQKWQGGGVSTAVGAGGGNGVCLDAAGGVASPGTAVQLYGCNGATAQQWTIASDGTIRALGLCLDVNGDSTTNGTPVQLWTCNGVGGQQWVRQGDGSMLNPQSGRCLDDPDGVLSNGTRLRIRDCNGAPAQLWRWNV